jgi:flavin reductase (DIM6/NTAB) family NADH-FMN oxidoreductase RutF
MSDFDDFAAHLDYPMFIATLNGGGTKAGCLVGFATQCSIEPVRFIVFLSDKNFTFQIAEKASTIALHLVPKSEIELARLFGEKTGDDIDKFTSCAWSPGPGGAPLLEVCPDRLVGRVTERIRGGDHDGFILEPLEASSSEVPFLMFQAAKDFDPGHDA